MGKTRLLLETARQESSEVRGLVPDLGDDRAVNVLAHAVLPRPVVVWLDELQRSAACTVVVTSRNRLPGLLSGHGAQHMSLDVLSDADAHALLAGRLGADRVDAEPAAVYELIELCNGFPLAWASSSLAPTRH